MHVELLITAFLNHVLTETLPRLSLPKVDVVVGLDARSVLFSSYGLRMYMLTRRS